MTLDHTYQTFSGSIIIGYRFIDRFYHHRSVIDLSIDFIIMDRSVFDLSIDIIERLGLHLCTGILKQKAHHRKVIVQLVVLLSLMIVLLS